MLHLLRNGQVYLWGPVLPIAAGIVTDGVLQWHSAAHSPTAAPSASLWRQKAALASTAVLPESAAADAVDSRLLMGRGDPRTKRGKVFKGSSGNARPKKKVDWKEWSVAQLGLPPKEISIPYPPPSKRTERLPELAHEQGPPELVEQSA